MSTALLPRSELRTWARVRTTRWLGAAAIEWTAIVTTIWVCHHVGRWWVYVPGAIFIGSRQHALGVLAHDGSHHLVARHRGLNDLLSDLLAAYPIGFTTTGFRTTHLRHHAYLETVRDPSRITVDLFPGDWTFPMRRRRVASIITRDLSGLSQASSSKLLKYLWEIPGGRGRHLAQLVAFHATAIAVATWLGFAHLYVVLWVVPLFTVAIAFYRIRAVAEHSGLDMHPLRYSDESADPLVATRTTIHSNTAIRFLFSPYNISYHVEHHLFPSIPVFELRKLHARLSDDAEFHRRVHVTPGHLGLLRELTNTA